MPTNGPLDLALNEADAICPHRVPYLVPGMQELESLPNDKGAAR